MKVPADSEKKIDVRIVGSPVTPSPMMMPIGVDSENSEIKIAIWIILKPVFAKPAPSDTAAQVLWMTIPTAN